MKKLVFAACVAAVAAAFAAFDVPGEIEVRQVIAPTTVSSGTTNAVAVAGGWFKGVSAFHVSAAASAGRVLDVTLYATNRAEGGWTAVQHVTGTDTNACVLVVPFYGNALPSELRLGVGSISNSSAVAVSVLSAK